MTTTGVHAELRLWSAGRTGTDMDIEPMILFALRCAVGHGFEAWFRDGAACDDQAQSGAIVCPVCGNREVTKAPMAPRIGKTSTLTGDAEHKRRRIVHEKLAKLREHIEQTCDYVGDRFAEEARRIHYGEADSRNIYGEAAPSEAETLQEEGIRIVSIPWPDRNHS